MTCMAVAKPGGAERPGITRKPRADASDTTARAARPPGAVRININVMEIRV